MPDDGLRSGIRPDTIGVLGGMGPLATAYFMRMVIEKTPVEKESDHIPMVLVSAPDIPDRVAPIVEGQGTSPLPALLERRNLLEAAGARCIVMPCNTAHHWYDELAADCSVPFLSIIDATCDALKKRSAATGRIGLIGTRATLKSGFYQKRFAHDGFECLLPEDSMMETTILPGIALVKRYQVLEGAKLFRLAVNALLKAGAETIILACTELDLALAEADDDRRGQCLDTNTILAEASVQWALDQRRVS